MKWISSTSIVLILLAGVSCSGPVACGGLKRLMYEGPWRDSGQRKDEVVAALGLELGARVADLGSGGGYFTFPIAEAVGSTGLVYAVDVDASLLAYVAKQAEKRDLPQIVTVAAPNDGMGLPDASVDLIFLSNVFHHLPDPVSYFDRARSVLRTGGRVAVLEVAAGGFPGGHATVPSEIVDAFEAAGYALSARHTFVERQSFQIFVPLDVPGVN